MRRVAEVYCTIYLYYTLSTSSSCVLASSSFIVIISVTISSRRRRPILYLPKDQDVKTVGATVRERETRRG